MQSREIHQLHTAPHNILVNKVDKIQNNVTFKFSLWVRNLIDWLIDVFYSLLTMPRQSGIPDQRWYSIYLWGES